MARSLRVAPEYINKVKSALQRHGYPRQQSLATDSGLGLFTVKSFLSGRPIDYLNFLELCTKLVLDWQEIAYKELETQPTGEASPFITGAPITQPRYFFGREKELKRLFNLLKCQPLILQILCRERLFTLEEGENDDNWCEESLRQMKPFADLFIRLEKIDSL
ncbi:hypothetical protein ACN23B_01415 [Anabaena sp. FACHB-709]|uniref:Uncharacterized protein n=2 Tax=Nostocaceae TaxID=1162 RepID=A0A1Z4KQK5_ANAVA|nr:MULTISPECIES: hypothetical protein [Nostocaceae]BAY71252.1 hypothetical protein NIES23_40690 [Trichormus variabilis NIES-23]MBD2174152.1 hypothetical protein [Anabaena cylindrica FACHB-318]MBD2265897.1 hypothetical protein [Anabaena sp. FACHB-709]MBD2275253.1 hypothetical protein [Nostoc sp. PCC 7120 = FACHB-418]MBD2286259.1 hypothetical protein [Anabaena cylindrica FACHB-170]